MDALDYFKVKYDGYGKEPIENFPTFPSYIPRTIFNDEVAELKLRSEGYSGRQQEASELDSFKLHDDFIDKASGKKYEKNTPKLENINEKYEQTIVFTEFGINILNLQKFQSLPPIPNKPKITCPVRVPVHFDSQHKALPSNFPKTERWGEYHSINFMVNPIKAKDCYETVDEIEKTKKKVLETNVLRYQRKFSTRPTVPEECDFTQVTGISFRGRGVFETELMKKYGDTEPIQDSTMSLYSVSQSNQDNIDQLTSIHHLKLGRKETNIKLSNQNEPFPVPSTQNKDFFSENQNKIDPRGLSEEQELESDHITVTKLTPRSIVQSPTEYQSRFLITDALVEGQEDGSNTEEQDDEEKWLQEQKKQLYGQWGREEVSEEKDSTSNNRTSETIAKDKVLYDDEEIPIAIKYNLSSSSLQDLRKQTQTASKSSSISQLKHIQKEHKQNDYELKKEDSFKTDKQVMEAQSNVKSSLSSKSIASSSLKLSENKYKSVQKSSENISLDSGSIVSVAILAKKKKKQQVVKEEDKIFQHQEDNEKSECYGLEKQKIEKLSSNDLVTQDGSELNSDNEDKELETRKPRWITNNITTPSVTTASSLKTSAQTTTSVDEFDISERKHQLYLATPEHITPVNIRQGSGYSSNSIKSTTGFSFANASNTGTLASIAIQQKDEGRFISSNDEPQTRFQIEQVYSIPNLYSICSGKNDSYSLKEKDTPVSSHAVSVSQSKQSLRADSNESVGSNYDNIQDPDANTNQSHASLIGQDSFIIHSILRRKSPLIKTEDKESAHQMTPMSINTTQINDDGEESVLNKNMASFKTPVSEKQTLQANKENRISYIPEAKTNVDEKTRNIVSNKDEDNNLSISAIGVTKSQIQVDERVSMISTPLSYYFSAISPVSQNNPESIHEQDFSSISKHENEVMSPSIKLNPLLNDAFAVRIANCEQKKIVSGPFGENDLENTARGENGQQKTAKGDILNTYSSSLPKADMLNKQDRSFMTYNTSSLEANNTEKAKKKRISILDAVNDEYNSSDDEELQTNNLNLEDTEEQIGNNDPNASSEALALPTTMVRKISKNVDVAWNYEDYATQGLSVVFEASSTVSLSAGQEMLSSPKQKAENIANSSLQNQVPENPPALSKVNVQDLVEVIENKPRPQLTQIQEQKYVTLLSTPSKPPKISENIINETKKVNNTSKISSSLSQEKIMTKDSIERTNSGTIKEDHKNLIRKVSKKINPFSKKKKEDNNTTVTETRANMYLNAVDAARLGVASHNQSLEDNNSVITANTDDKQSKAPISISGSKKDEPINREHSTKNKPGVTLGGLFRLATATSSIHSAGNTTIGESSNIKLDNVGKPNILEFIPMKPIKVNIKGMDCTVSVDERELKCIDNGKSKPAKHFFPLDYRRIINADAKGDTLIIYAIVAPKQGKKGGSKLKKISFQCESISQPVMWAEFLRGYVYGDEGLHSLSKKVIVLIDKYEGQAQGKLIDKYIKPVFEACEKPFIIQNVDFNDFNLNKALEPIDFNQVSNIVTVATDFAPRLSQLLVRNRWATNITNLSCDIDPCDAAMTIMKSGMDADYMYMSALHLKKEEGTAIASIFRRK